MKPRRIVGLSILAIVLAWMWIAGSLEGRRIDAQRATHPPPATRMMSLRVDSDRLMAAVATLADPKFEGRGTGTSGNLAARAWLEGEMTAAGLASVSGARVFPFQFSHVSIKGLIDPDRAFKTDYTNAANLAGLCMGTEPAKPMFVISSHYDHLGIRNGQIYPGADDDASGVAVMLELARYCGRTPFRHSVVFAAFDGEELGMQGSQAFLIQPPVPKARLALDINLDMVSRNDRRELFVAGPYHWPLLKKPIEDVAARAPISLLFGHDRPIAIAGGVEDWTMQSDHGAFHKEGIPFVYFGVEDHPDYHRPTDTADKIDRGFFVDVAETVLDSVLALDRLDAFKP